MVFLQVLGLVLRKLNLVLLYAGNKHDLCLWSGRVGLLTTAYLPDIGAGDGYVIAFGA